MKITMEAYGRKVTYEMDDDTNISDVACGVKACLIGMTWHEDAINEMFDEWKERIHDTENNSLINAKEKKWWGKNIG